MVEVKIRAEETVSSLIKRFKRVSQFKKYKFREREYFIKPSKRRELKKSKRVAF